MEIFALFAALCGLLLLLAGIPAMLAAGVVVVMWAWQSGFLATLGVCFVVIAVIAWLDPREHRRGSK